MTLALTTFVELGCKEAPIIEKMTTQEKPIVAFRAPEVNSPCLESQSLPVYISMDPRQFRPADPNEDSMSIELPKTGPAWYRCLQSISDIPLNLVPVPYQIKGDTCVARYYLTIGNIECGDSINPAPISQFGLDLQLSGANDCFTFTFAGGQSGTVHYFCGQNQQLIYVLPKPVDFDVFLYPGFIIGEFCFNHYPIVEELFRGAACLGSMEVIIDALEKGILLAPEYWGAEADSLTVP